MYVNMRAYLIAQAKEWMKQKWHELGVYLFWPKYEYKQDFMSPTGQWYITLVDPLSDVHTTFSPGRNDITDLPDVHKHYNIITHNLQSAWLFDQFQLSTKLRGTVYVLAKGYDRKKLVESGKNKNQLTGLCKSHDLDLNKLVDLDIKTYFPKVLSENEKREVAEFLSHRFDDIADSIPKTSTGL
jgi:hypothetical protein